MEAILTIPKKDINFEFDNLTINEYAMIGTRPNEFNYMIDEKYTIGKPITLITSNMPDRLRQEIELMITNYYNH